ncbi:MAG: PH domain-containing protein [Terracoccus sp.]
MSHDGGPSPTDESSPGRRPALRGARTLRPGSAVATGAVAAAAGLALLVPALLASPRNWTLISSLVLALVLVWLFVVRPAAVIHEEGIRLVNPMRVVDLTWPAIAEVRSRWALEMFADGVRYTAWGIPSDPKRPRYGREILKIGVPRSVPGRGKGKSAAEEPGADTPEPSARPKVEAQTVAAEVEAAMAADRRRRGATPRIATQAWDPVSVGLLLSAVAFLALSLLAG